MANRFFPKGKEKILNGDIDFNTDTIKARLVRDTYVFDNNHEFVSSVVAVTSSVDQTLTAPTITGGVFDANDVTFTSVAAGETASSVVLYKFVTNDADSPVLAIIDTITGFPKTTDGGNITVQWDNGAYKIFSL